MMKLYFKARHYNGGYFRLSLFWFSHQTRQLLTNILGHFPVNQPGKYAQKQIFYDESLYGLLARHGKLVATTRLVFLIISKRKKMSNLILG